MINANKGCPELSCLISVPLYIQKLQKSSSPCVDYGKLVWLPSAKPFFIPYYFCGCICAALVCMIEVACLTCLFERTKINLCVCQGEGMNINARGSWAVLVILVSLFLHILLACESQCIFPVACQNVLYIVLHNWIERMLSGVFRRDSVAEGNLSIVRDHYL